MFQGVRDASVAPVLVDEEDALGGALLPAGIVKLYKPTSRETCEHAERPQPAQ